MIEKTALGQSSLSVGLVGLGCMGMSAFYTGANSDADEAVRTIHRALDLGCTLIDTAEMYGPFTNEELVGAALRGRRDQAVVATKFGFITHSGGRSYSQMNSRPENIIAATEGSLKRLGVDTIDLLYQHRPDPEVPVEDVVGTIADLIRQGKVVAYGLSEADPQMIRRAHAVHPMAALQTEYSLWTRHVEAEIIPTLRDLGISLVPYSPLGRGFLTGTIKSPDDLDQGDFRRGNPRFARAAFESNMAIVNVVREVGDEVGASPAQVALAWLTAQGGERHDVVPIPGTKRVSRLEENIASVGVRLSDQQVQRLSDLPAPQGSRY